MRNNFVRCKDQQEPEEIEYRIEDSVTELMTEGISIKTYGIAAYRKGHKLEQRKDVTTEKPVWNTWWNCAIRKNFLFATLMM